MNAILHILLSKMHRRNINIRILVGRKSLHVTVGLKVWMKWRKRIQQNTITIEIKIHICFRWRNKFHILLYLHVVLLNYIDIHKVKLVWVILIYYFPLLVLNYTDWTWKWSFTFQLIKYCDKLIKSAVVAAMKCSRHWR